MDPRHSLLFPNKIWATKKVFLTYLQSSIIFHRRFMRHQNCGELGKGLPAIGFRKQESLRDVNISRMRFEQPDRPFPNFGAAKSVLRRFLAT